MLLNGLTILKTIKMNKNQKLKIAHSLITNLTTTKETCFIVKRGQDRLLLIAVNDAFYHIDEISEICKPLKLLSLASIIDNKVCVSIF